MCDLTCFIERAARKLARRHRNCCLDADDLSQEGHIAWMKAQRTWKPRRGDFLPYAIGVVTREMAAAAIAAKGPVSGSLKVKKRALRAAIMLRKGYGTQRVGSVLGVSPEEVTDLLRIMAPVVRGDKWRCEKEEYCS